MCPVYLCWCFSKSNPINSGGSFPGTRRYLRKGGRGIEARMLGRRVRHPDDTSSWAVWEGEGWWQRGIGAPVAAPSPSHDFCLHRCTACFHYSYFVWYHDMKESCFLHGEGHVTAGSRVTQFPNKSGRGGGEAVFLDSKHRNSLH